MIIQKARDPWIDVLRGLGILLVVLGHTSYIPPSLQTFIYSFHLPLFFCIAGYLFNMEKYRNFSFFNFIADRFVRLMIPYFSMAILCLLFISLKDFKNHVFEWSVFGRYVEGILYSRGTVYSMPSCSPLWFLSCLYVIQCLFFVILKGVSGQKFQFAIILFAAVCGGILSTIQAPKFIWNSDTALTGIVFFYLGYLARSFSGFKDTLKYKYLPFLILISFFAIKFNYVRYVSFDENRFGNVALMYLGALAGIGIFMFFAKALLAINNQKVSNFVIFWGTNTLPVIGFDYLTLNILNAVLVKLSLESFYVLNFILHLGLLVILIKVINLNKISHSLIYGSFNTR